MRLIFIIPLLYFGCPYAEGKKTDQRDASQKECNKRILLMYSSAQNDTEREAVILAGNRCGNQ